MNHPQEKDLDEKVANLLAANPGAVVRTFSQMEGPDVTVVILQDHSVVVAETGEPWPSDVGSADYL